MEDPGGPVVMLNLLRLRPDGGRDRYRKYLEHFRRTSAPYGAEVGYPGDGSTAVVAEDGQAWDEVLPVRYPSRRAFSDMIRDPAYQEVSHLHTEAVLQARRPWERARRRLGGHLRSRAVGGPVSLMG